MQEVQEAMGNACDKMEEGLWLGDKGVYDTERPEYKRFPTIVTALTEEEVTRFRIREKLEASEHKHAWLHVPVDDEETEDISQHFQHVYEFIEVARARGDRVLIHCAGGISRSATLMAAYLMRKRGWTRKVAMEHIIARRKIVDPNSGFMRQLLECEEARQIHYNDGSK